MTPKTVDDPSVPKTPETPEHVGESRQQLVGGKKSSRVIFPHPKPRGYAVQIDGEFLRRSGDSYTSSTGWQNLPGYVQKAGKKVLDDRMEELKNADAA